eukprot:gnl/TRDRNA2_/TRDRNA2_82000_c0_seq1.p1 gnl/TRDRNA2_/TRDRNA2_82000_c0~~gnl/TRDRNA2_/TRDRNA2_82000_c0_seq1.p1  ORF type:complete len:426 (-),score=55.01 gnl/TRDRNA2_/TRDRNA2_82000_c0_seq1:183-1460(-)
MSDCDSGGHLDMDTMQSSHQELSGLMSPLMGLSAVFCVFIMRPAVATLRLLGVMSRPRQPFADVDLHGEVIVITGANTGIGFAAASQAAAAGATVILACRSLQRGEAACQAIRDQCPSAKVSTVHLDLSSFSSVRQCAAQIESHLGGASSGIYGLVLNAGIPAVADDMSLQRIFRKRLGLEQGAAAAVTADGFNCVYQANFLGHYLLTRLLEPLIKKRSEAGGRRPRVVTLSSVAHHLGSSDVLKEATSSGPTYTSSKWAAVGLAVALNHRWALEADRAGGESTRPHSLAFAVNPGAVRSDIWRIVRWPVVKQVYDLFMRMVYLTCAEGAVPIAAALSTEPTEGEVRDALAAGKAGNHSQYLSMPVWWYLQPYFARPLPLPPWSFDILGPFAGAVRGQPRTGPAGGLAVSLRLWEDAAKLCQIEG